MEHRESLPPEELSDFVRCFWHNRRDCGKEGSTFEVVPDSYAEIIFHFGSGCCLSENSVLTPLPSPFMMGLLNQPVVFFAKNVLQIVSVRCYPWTVFELLGLPSGKKGARLVKHPIAALQHAMNLAIQSGNADKAIAIVRQYLLDTRADVTLDSTLSRVATAMKKSNGSMSVSNMAEQAHSTVRTLERKFKQSSGFAVKDVAGIMRFEQARNHLWLHPESKLAQLAHDLGYTDQSHFSREFKRYTGTTPAAFARKTKDQKQTVTGDFVAFIQE